MSLMHLSYEPIISMQNIESQMYQYTALFINDNITINTKLVNNSKLKRAVFKGLEEEKEKRKS